jgi:hypothetical protein
MEPISRRDVSRLASRAERSAGVPYVYERMPDGTRRPIEEKYPQLAGVTLDEFRQLRVCCPDCQGVSSSVPYVDEHGAVEQRYGTCETCKGAKVVCPGCKNARWTEDRDRLMGERLRRCPDCWVGGRYDPMAEAYAIGLWLDRWLEKRTREQSDEVLRKQREEQAESERRRRVFAEQREKIAAEKARMDEEARVMLEEIRAQRLTDAIGAIDDKEKASEKTDDAAATGRGAGERGEETES